MKLATSAAALGAASVLAQNITSSSSSGNLALTLGQAILSELSASCQQTVVSLLSPNSTLGSCIHTDLILGIVSSNSSIVPPLDSYLSTICASTPCDPYVLANVSAQVSTGCAADLMAAGISNSTVQAVFANYPLAREIACLKTVMPFNGTNASIPVVSPQYNHTNGTFCVTSVLTEVSAYLGANLTNNYVDTFALGANSSATRLLKSIPPSALCSDCIFAAVDLIEEEYPTLGMLQLGNSTMNTTLNQLLNGTCAAQSYNVTMNGTLPSTISEVAYNSSFGYNVTGANFTYTPPAYASTVPALNATVLSAASSAIASATPAVAANASSTGVSARGLKARWVGQQ